MPFLSQPSQFILAWDRRRTGICWIAYPHGLGEEMYGIWGGGSRPRGRPKSTWKEVVQKDCQARNLNKEDAMDRGRWKKLIKWMMIRIVRGWVLLLVPAHPGSPGQRAVNRLLLLLLLLLLYVLTELYLLTQHIIASISEAFILVNNATRMIFNLSRQEHAMLCLIQLHQLPACFIITYKIALWCTISEPGCLHVTRPTLCSLPLPKAYILLCAISQRQSATSYKSCVPSSDSALLLWPSSMETCYLKCFRTNLKIYLLKLVFDICKMLLLISPSSYHYLLVFYLF